MIIGRKAHSAGDTIRYEIDYDYFLESGRTLLDSNFSVTLAASGRGTIPTDVTISNVSVTSSKLYFYLAGGSVNEVFTVQVQVEDSLNEVVIDTIEFVITPA